MEIRVTPRHLPDGPDGMPGQPRPDCRSTRACGPDVGRLPVLISSTIIDSMEAVTAAGHDPFLLRYEVEFVK